MKTNIILKLAMGICLCLGLLSSGVNGNANSQPLVTYHEAPMLGVSVRNGTLPPVGQRLPANPVVLTPLNSVGKYGGIWHTVSWWDGIGNVLLKMYDPPIRWTDDYSGYEPGLAESYGWSPDGKTFTLHLRVGLKWSDGQPYTSEDWRFWWQDIATNSSYPNANVPIWLKKSDGSPVDMVFPDDYTVAWTSDVPQYVYPYYIAQGFWEFANPMMKPAHYLKQFHPDYNPSASYNDLAAADQWWNNPDFPTVLAWHCYQVERVDDIQVFIFERNAYYWKVDTAGNQLPYIDYLSIEVIPDATERLNRTAAGLYDATFRGVNSPEDIPFLQANAAAHGYHLQTGWMNGAGTWPGYMVDQDYVAGGNNYPDDTPEHAAQIRTLLRDKRFRKALSVGFSRQEVIDVAWGGSGEPKQATISPQAQHFTSPEGQLVYQEWAASDATENLSQANAWLNDIGMLDSNADGWRDLPSGLPFTLIIDITDWGGSYAVQYNAALEMKHQWESNLKINVQVNDLQNNIYQADQRNYNGWYMVRGVHVAEIDLWTFPDWVFPVHNQYIFPLAGLWYETHGAEGLAPEPGSPAALLQALYEKGMAESDFHNRQEIFYDAVDIHIDEGPFVIGVSGDQPASVVVKDNFHNVPTFGVTGPWAPASPGNMHPEQFWINLQTLYLPMVRR